MSEQSLHDLEVLIESGHSLIVLETEREGAFLDGFRRLAQSSSRAYFQWSITRGLERLAAGFTPQPLFKDINQLFGLLHSTTPAGVYILVDFHHFLEDPVAIRHIKDVRLNSPQHSIVLLSRQITLPTELKSEATVFRLPLPSASQLKSMVNNIALEWSAKHARKVKASSKEVTRRLLDALQGLPIGDATRLARNAIFNDGILDERDLREIMQSKFDLLDSSNLLQFELDFKSLEEIAGLENLKSWLAIREPIFSGATKIAGADVPKGILLLGVQGCGKSMAAKAVAGSWKLPLLYLDFAVLYNRFYGQTEENLRSALQTAEKMQPCVLWIDEIDKGISAQASNDDVSERVLGTFLTWLAEHKARVFIVATANNVADLPPELMRKGRFDEVFFVGLPSSDVRKRILEVHLQRRDVSPSTLNIEEVVGLTEGFSGAELEQVVVSALYEAAALGTPIDTPALVKSAQGTRPLSVLMRERIEALYSWAESRTIPA